MATTNDEREPQPQLGTCRWTTDTDDEDGYHSYPKHRQPHPRLNDCYYWQPLSPAPAPEGGDDAMDSDHYACFHEMLTDAQLDELGIHQGLDVQVAITRLAHAYSDAVAPAPGRDAGSEKTRKAANILGISEEQGAAFVREVEQVEARGRDAGSGDVQTLLELVKKATPGPWYVAADNADDCPDHKNSGLALVDTGRHADWPIARLCEWNNAKLIAAVPALADAVEAQSRRYEITVNAIAHAAVEQAAQARRLEAATGLLQACQVQMEGIMTANDMKRLAGEIDGFLGKKP